MLENSMDALERAARQVTSPGATLPPGSGIPACFNPSSPKHLQSPPSSGSRLGRSPRDRMKIDHLLSSPRNCFSPRFGPARVVQLDNAPQRFTNRFCESTNVRRPQNVKESRNQVVKEEGKSETSVEDQVQGLSALDLLSNAAANWTVENTEETDPAAHKSKNEEQDRPAIKREAVSEFFPVNLFVAAVGEGKIDEDTPAKTREVLEQIMRKVSKEQNTVVNVHEEGLLHIQLRVFAASSVEAKALKEYVASHPQQQPAPFIVLAKHLPMAVCYDADALDPAQASIADRLRKQAKTRAIKLLREVVLDSSSRVTTAMLRGKLGPTLPAETLEPLLQKRTVAVDQQAFPPSSGVGGGKFVLFPAIIRRSCDAPAAPTASLSCHGDDNVDAEPRDAADKSTQSDSRAGGLRGGGGGGGGGACAVHFPVRLMVMAIGEGEIEASTQPKLLHRLELIKRKVPKEHQSTIDLPAEASSAELRLRLFVANSEDAKAAQEYVGANKQQRPVPFVILAHALPIAVSYDARTMAVTDANVVDCLRKQAKTRAVKLLKEVMTSQAVGMTLSLLRGHQGALAPAQLLEGPLMEHAISFVGGTRYISFPARNRQGDAASSSGGGSNLFSGGSAFRRLESLAAAADGHDAGEEGQGEGAQPQLSQQRECEMCRASNDGSYGTGRFCSKTCRYEAHALRVAMRRRLPADGARQREEEEEEMETEEGGGVMAVEEAEGEAMEGVEGKRGELPVGQKRKR